MFNQIYEKEIRALKESNKLTSSTDDKSSTEEIKSIIKDKSTDNNYSNLQNNHSVIEAKAAKHLPFESLPLIQKINQNYNQNILPTMIINVPTVQVNQNSLQDINKTADTNLIFLSDTVSKIKYLIDCGAQVSILPSDLIPSNINLNDLQPTPYSLSNAAGQHLESKGFYMHKLTYDNHVFKYRFIVADISYPILGIDFLRFYNFKIDPNKNIIYNDEVTIPCSTFNFKCDHIHLNVIKESNPVLNLLLKYPHLTSDQRKPIEHQIEHVINTNNHPPIKASHRNYSPNINLKIEKQFTELLEQNIVKRSNSSWSSPLAIVNKKNGDIRICGDYRKLNLITQPDNYNIPNLNSFNYKLNNKKVFSVIDLKQAYHLIKVKESDIDKTTVSTPIGSFAYNYMPFGLKTAANTFQRLIDTCLQECFNFVFIYFDDILVFSESVDEHLKHLDKIFYQLDKFSLKININKCVFLKSSVKYLGYLVDSNGYSPDNDKIQAINNIEVPANRKQLAKFISTISYYSKFIPNFQVIAKELYAISPVNRFNKFERISLNDKQLESFNQLKSALSHFVKLSHPVVGSRLIVNSDASMNGLGCSLHQEVNKELKPIYFYSKRFKGQQIHYDIYKKELEALFIACKRFSKFLIGNRTVAVIDNKNLYHNLIKPKEATPVEMRRLIFISEMIDEIILVESKDNPIADYFSRLYELNHYYLGQQVNYHRLFLEQQKDEQIQSIPIDQVHQLKLFSYGPSKFLLKIKKDPSGRNLILVPKTMVNDIVLIFHNLYHPGIRATLKLLSYHFTWPHMSSDVAKLVRACVSCQKNKYDSNPSHQPFKLIATQYKKFQYIHVDLIEIRSNSNYKYALTIIDRNTKYLVIVPIKDSSSNTVTEAFITRWIMYFGIPLIVYSDQGSNFIGENSSFQLLLRTLGIQHLTSFTYHPQANGLLERQHLKIKSSIRCLNGSDIWEQLIPFITLFWNNSLSSNAEYTPHQLVYFSSAQLPLFMFESSNSNVVNNNNQRDIMQFVSSLSPQPTTHNSAYQTPYINPELKNAKYVYIKNCARNSKMDTVFNGPFKVKEKFDNYFEVYDDNRSVKKISIDRIKPAYFLNEK